MDQKENDSSIGLIGIGLLGLALAERLRDQGYQVCGFDTNVGQTTKFAERGGVVLPDSLAVLKQCNITLVCLPTSELTLSLIEHSDRSLPPGQIVLDATTGDPQQMMAISESLKKQEVDYVEMLVAGSSSQARTGAATLLIGGSLKIVERVKPLLVALADHYFYMGPVGSASRFKLVHNLVLGLHRAVLAEGLTFAKGLGFDPEQTLHILQQTPAASSVMSAKGTKMVTGDYEPHARLSQHLKDVRLILSESQRAGVQIPLSRVHLNLLERAEALGFGQEDNSAVIEALRG